MDHLTQVVLAAEAAGKSYGMYVAERHEQGLTALPMPIDTQKQEEKEVWRRCMICGGLIPPELTKRANTCSPACSAERNRRRNREFYQRNIKFKPEAPSKCEFCGKDFMQNRRNQRFCNIRCQEAHNRAVKRGEAANTGMTPGMANRSYGTGVCVICGEQYIKRSARQLTCSDWCRKVHVDKRRKEGKC